MQSNAPVLGGARAWVVWAIAVTFVVYYFSFQTGYSIVNANVQQDVGLSVAQVGLIAALYTWVFAICQFLSGALLDRIGDLFSDNPASEQAVQTLAARRIGDAARASDLTSRAERNTAAMLRELLRGLGFERVTVTFV